MANNLTGDYEAVLQVSVRQINGLLATLHQNGGVKDKSPSFPHRAVRVAVGGLPKVLSPKIVQFSRWLGGAVQSLRTSGGPGGGPASPLEIGAHYAEKAPPGAVAKFKRELSDLIAARDEAPPHGRVRGFADVQISTPAISLVRSEVVVHVYVRAHYYPEGDTPPLPGPIHGEVRVSYELAPKTVDGNNVLEVVTPADDSKVRFFPAPGSGMTQATADSAIAVHVRKAIRERFTPTPVGLPKGFAYSQFKGLGNFGNLHDDHWIDALGTGDEQALVLPVQLSGGPAPPGGLDGVTNLFLGTGAGQNDFAIAVSKEYVATQFAPTLDELRQFKVSFTATVKFLGVKVYEITYHVSVTSVVLQFQSGSIDLNIKAEATTRNLGAPQYKNIAVTQRLRLVLVGQSIVLQAFDSDFTISGAPGEAKGEITAARDHALHPPPPAKSPGATIGETFEKARQQLTDALFTFDDSASASYTAVEITPDGVVVRGSIDTKWHGEPVLVPPGETDGGKSFTALDTWAPGGRIDRYRWEWCEGVVYTTPSGVTWTIPWECKAGASGDQPHSFTFGKPAALQARPIWSPGVCLAIEGTQVLPDGRTRGVAGRWGTCGATAREPFVVLDPLTEAIYGALGWPEPPAPDGALQEALNGHVNVLAAHPLPAGGPGTNTLIYFAGPHAAQPLQALDRALAQVRRRDFALTLVVVLPRGAFAASRREVEGRLGLPGESRPQALAARADEGRPGPGEDRLPVPLVVTEDYLGGWTRTFGVTEAPASYLVNARGEFVWKQEGGLAPDGLAAALDDHLLPSYHRPPLPLRLAVEPGGPALDATFEDDGGRALALRRLRGKGVLLLFWQSWSTPCVNELERLQRLHEAGGERVPVIVAVNGGEGREVIAEVRRQHRLTFPLVPDPGQRVAQLYGVACWPTTVSVNAQGVVDRIQFGVPHEHTAPPKGRGPDAR